MNLSPLYRRIDNSPLIAFRILFGILVALECFGAILTGWVRRNLVEPEFAFPFIGFEWLEPLAGPGLYGIFALMGLLGIGMAAGYRYRFCAVLFTVLWTGCYLMQKTAYNNHYYLLILISGIMSALPAHRAVSADARRNPALRTDTMYSGIKWLVVAQLFIVYTYAAIAKLYEHWTDFSFIAVLMEPRADYPVIGALLQQQWAHRIIGIFGIAFDFLIVPLLLWKRTRIWAFGFAIFFHLFNSVVFQIGIFPYLSLAFCVFFFEPETIRKRFFPRKAPGLSAPGKPPPKGAAILWITGLYLLFQVLLPMRHHLIAGDVLWTEEGHRLSWRMMLRSRNGDIRYRVVDRATGENIPVNLADYLTPAQQRKVQAYPDFIWQFARYLKTRYAREGRDVSVFARGQVRINREAPAPFVDPDTDLAAVPWDPWRHHAWILPAPWMAGTARPGPAATER